MPDFYWGDAGPGALKRWDPEEVWMMLWTGFASRWVAQGDRMSGHAARMMLVQRISGDLI